MMRDATIEHFIADIRAHPEADFYRSIWAHAGSYSALPHISQAELARCPLSHRTYKKEQGIVRIVHGPDGPFLSAWGFSDIAREPYGLPAQRPLVYFTDPHDTVEKSMWSYFNHMVPLAGEKNIPVTVLAARAFEVDALISDPVAIADLLPYLEERTTRFSSISLVSDVFRPEDLMRYRAYAERIRLVLSLPETGAFATAELAEKTTFSLLENCFIEEGETIVLTKVAPLVTPIVRFNTGIPVSVIRGQ